jgi:hypothetical protein
MVISEDGLGLYEVEAFSTNKHISTRTFKAEKFCTLEEAIIWAKSIDLARGTETVYLTRIEKIAISF